jgi:hypothetical protein
MPSKGLAITSFVLGILSLVLLCFGFFVGVPAVICGHMARRRARTLPAQFGGEGIALAGLITGYIGLVLGLLMLPMLLPPLSRAKARAQEISCVSSMQQIGIAFRTWSVDHQGEFPFNVSTNKGGTLELCSPDTDGFDKNSVVHFRVMHDEFGGSARVFVCPADSSKWPALNWTSANQSSLQPGNVSYRVHVGKKVNETNPGEILVICPIHGTILRCDCSVELKPRK